MDTNFRRGMVLKTYEGVVAVGGTRYGRGDGGGTGALPYRLTADDDLPAPLRARLLNAYHRAAGLPAVVLPAVCALLVIAVQWSSADARVLAAWTVAMVVVAMAGGVAHAAYATSGAGRDDRPDRWALLFTLLSGLTGTAWGAAALLFLDPAGDPLISLFVGLVIVALAAAAALAKAPLLGAAAAFVVPALGLLTLRVLAYPGPFPLALGLVVVVAGAVLMALARSHHQARLDAIVLTLANQDLTARLDSRGESFRTLVENISDLVAVVDERGLLRFHSPSAERLLGWRADQLTGRPLADLVHPDDLPGVMGDLERLLDDPQQVGSRAVRMRHAFGEWRTMTVHGRAMPLGEHGASVVLSAQDATEQVRVREALEVARTQAEDAGRAKSDFLATMSHEIRTPMAGIIGLIDLLKATALSDKQGEYVRALDRAGEHLADLLDDILDFSKIEAGHVETEDAAFDLRKTVSGVLDIFRAGAAAKGVDMRASIAHELPRLWHGDARHLRQVLANLVGNAVKFTDHGFIELRITTDGAAVTGTTSLPLLFAVEDTGVGIAAEKVGCVFEPFAQADTTNNRRYGGTGLGLAISRRLVELTGGRIWVVSRPDHGSTFFFTAPLRPASVQTPRRLRAATGPVARLAGARVLVVDDSDLNRLVIGDMISGLGPTVDTASNGAEAVEMFRDTVYDLVFLDIQMPVMDGFGAARAMRAVEEDIRPDDRPTPIVALSATALKDDRDTALDCGCNTYVVKPLRLEALNSLLKTYLPTVDDMASDKWSGVGASPRLASSAPAPTFAATPRKEVFEPELAPLLPSFFRHLDQELDGLRRALDVGDPAAVRRLAHAAKGNAMLFGFTALVDLLRGLETLARDATEAATDAVAPPDAAENISALRGGLDAIEAEAAVLRDRLREHLPEPLVHQETGT